MFNFVNDRTLDFLYKTEEIRKLFSYFCRFPISTVKQLVPFFAMKMEVGLLKTKNKMELVYLSPSNRTRNKRDVWLWLDEYKHAVIKSKKRELTTFHILNYLILYIKLKYLKGM